jgi:predicted nucleic acid-binding protein
MVVFDASTLILIAKADLLEHFLSGIRMPVVIPAEVERECCGTKRTIDAITILKALDKSEIKKVVVGNRRLVTKLQGDFNLGKGEAEAIALALDEGAQLIGIDDKHGINACRLMGIAFTTALGILVRAREKQLLGDAEALEKLVLLAKYGRYKESIIEEARRRLEGKP